jgi:23S rRNA (pseudouridine1915-N3)-methyltransferase
MAVVSQGVRYTVVAVGRIRPPFADDVEHYRTMLSGHARVDVVEVRDDDQVERRIPDRSHRVLLDIGGRAYASEAFARWLEERRQDGRDLCFVIGGPYGLELPHVEHRLSFGKLTLPYQLARVVLLEQLYRAHKILAREPYHY